MTHFIERGALISDCGKFRYRLWRRWDISLPVACFVMLNPSTADASVDDATIRKCIGFAERLGFGSIEVVNLFAYRATDPKDLRRAGYPVGPDNDAHFEWVAHDADRRGSVICAWGTNAAKLQRPADVIAMLRRWHIKPKALQINGHGIPAHPLMLPYTCRLRELMGGRVVALCESEAS